MPAPNMDIQALIAGAQRGSKSQLPPPMPLAGSAPSADNPPGSPPEANDPLEPMFTQGLDVLTRLAAKLQDAGRPRESYMVSKVASQLNEILLNCETRYAAQAEDSAESPLGKVGPIHAMGVPTNY